MCNNQVLKISEAPKLYVRMYEVMTKKPTLVEQPFFSNYVIKLAENITRHFQTQFICCIEVFKYVFCICLREKNI